MKFHAWIIFPSSRCCRRLDMKNVIDLFADDENDGKEILLQTFLSRQYKCLKCSQEKYKLFYIILLERVDRNLSRYFCLLPILSYFN